MGNNKTEKWKELNALNLSIQRVEANLKQLKDSLNWLSVDEKNEKLWEVENSIIICSDNLELLEKNIVEESDKKELNKLKTKIDKVKNEYDLLKKSVINDSKKELSNLSSSVKVTNWEISPENQNRWWKTKNFVSEQWRDVFDKEKWKEESGKNILRTAGFVATGVWAISLLVWLWKRIFGKKDDVENDEKKDEADGTQKKKSRKEKREERRQKRKERRENRPRWQKFLIWSAIAWWTAVWWVQIYKNWNKIKWRFKDLLGLNLSFDEAKQKVESEVRNWINSDNKTWNFYAHFDENGWIKYDEATQSISSYWESIKIDYKNKKLEWLEVEFPDYEQLIHAANLVNFCKRKLAWRWANQTPFEVITWWDLAFKMQWTWNTWVISTSDTNLWASILWIWWTVTWWLLWWYCAWIKWAAIWAVSWWVVWGTTWAVIDENSSLRKMCDCIKKWKNLERFVNYLNNQKNTNWESLWLGHDQQLEPEDKSPIQTYLNKIITEIEDAYWNGEDDSARRTLQVEFDENNPEKFLVKSYNHETYLTLKWCTAKQWEIWIDFSKIKKIHVEKYDEKDWWDWLDIDFPHNEAWLKEAIRTINLTNKIREDRSYKWWEDYPFAYGRYLWHWKWFWLDVDIKGAAWKQIVSHSVLEDKFPTIADDLEEYNTVSWFFQNQQNERNDEAKQDKSTWSQYIKFLHQITWWTGKKWYWKDNS